MRVVVHHTKFIEWEPVPADVVVTQADQDAGRVKPNGRGGWLMRVVKTAKDGTHTTVHVSEETLIEKIVHEKARLDGGRTFTRKQALEALLRENCFPHTLVPTTISKIEIHDDQHEMSEERFRAILAAKNVVHARTGLPIIHPDDHDEHVAAYLEKADAAAHVAHLHASFRVKGAA